MKRGIKYCILLYKSQWNCTVLSFIGYEKSKLLILSIRSTSQQNYEPLLWKRVWNNYFLNMFLMVHHWFVLFFFQFNHFQNGCSTANCSLVCVNGVDINEDPRVKCENIWRQKCWQKRLGNIRHRRFGFKEVRWYESEHVKTLFAHNSVWEDLYF